MKRLPPPGSGNGSKLPSRCPPPGHPALKRDFHVRFDMLTQMHRSLVKNYEELKHASGSDTVRYLMTSLVPIDDEEVDDKLEWLWPTVEDIHRPPRKYYALRCSVLVGGFPSAAPHSPEVFTNTLLSRVLVKAPSCMVLESACCELIDTYKYSNAPNIADLLALIEKHKALWSKRLEIQREIESGRAREFAQGRLEYEEQQERRKVERTIACLEKLNQPEMIAELNEHGIDALDEEFEDKVRELEREAQEQARLEEQKRKEADPKYKAIVAFLKQFKLYERHHDELVEDLYKRDIPAEAIAAIANGNGVPLDTLRDINRRLAHNYMPTRDFIKSATFKALHLKEPKKAPRLQWNEWDADDDDGRHGARIRF